MKFKITRSSFLYTKYEDHPQPHPKATMKSMGEDSHWTIEIKNLDELLDIARNGAHDGGCVIHADPSLFAEHYRFVNHDLPVIEIYDSYRE